MKTVETQKFVAMLPPVSANNGAHSGNTYVDTAGWSHLRVLFMVGSIASSSTIGSTSGTAAPKLEWSDSSGSGYADITSAALADAIADGEDNGLFAIDLDLTKTRKRYVRVNAPTAGAAGAAVLGILGILSGKESGSFGGGASESGLTEKISA